MSLSLFTVRLRLDGIPHYATYHVEAATAIKAIEKVYKRFDRETRDYASQSMTVLSLERIEGKVVR